MSDDIPFCGNSLLLWWLIHHTPPRPEPDGPIYRTGTDRILYNIDIILATGVLIATAMLYPDKAFSLRWGALLWVPTVRLVANIITNNLPNSTKNVKGS
jgi:hypothetical protein